VIRSRHAAAVAAAAIVVGLTFFVPTTAGTATNSLSASSSAVAPDVRVLAISIDGLNPGAIRKLGRDDAPNFYRLWKDGASTANARTVVEQTRTLPNHTSMMTGRRVTKAKGGHGVTWDHNIPGSTVQGAAGHPVASIFDVVHDEGYSTALFAAKRKFSLYQRSWPEAISHYTAVEDDKRLTRRARNDLLRKDRALTFLHLALPDVTGHAKGFRSEAYVRAVRRTDVQLGKLLRAVDNHPELAEDLVVVLTADHGGGIGRSHANSHHKVNYRIPFFVWGTGVADGDLYDLNPTYKNPAGSRPSYAGEQPVRNGDLANLVADLLGLGPVPGSRFDADQLLSVGP
jgi:predicted AlkP superfamily pyrophosphatase or phosphodiesterase